MNSIRLWVMAAIGLALAGCASNGYSQYPSGTYYDNNAYYDGQYYPYYGYGYGYDYDDDHDRYFRPEHGVICDRERDVCFDRYGPSYTDTKRYLGERSANRSYKKYGDQVFLFSPKHGVVCDRRKHTCTNGQWDDSAFFDNPPHQRPQREIGNKGAIGSPPVDNPSQPPIWPMPLSNMNATGDKAHSHVVPPMQQRDLADSDNDNDEPIIRSKVHAQSDDSERPAVKLNQQRPTDNANAPSDGACMFKACDSD